MVLGVDLDETDLVTTYVWQAKAMDQGPVVERLSGIIEAMVLEELVRLDRREGRDPTARITNDYRAWVLHHALDDYGVPRAEGDD